MRSLHRQRGMSDLLMYGLIALAVLAMLSGLYWAVYSAGQASIQRKWDAANEKESRKEAERKAGEQKILLEEKAKRLAAEQDAASNLEKWRLTYDELRKSNTRLAGAVCPPRRPVQPIAKRPVTPGAPIEPKRETVPSVEDGADIRMSWGFVGLWDSTWTDDQGKPVFGSAEGVLKRAGQSDPSALSPYGPGEILDNHAKNSNWCSALKRKYNSLIDTLQRLESDWTRAMATQ